MTASWVVSDKLPRSTWFYILVELHLWAHAWSKTFTDRHVICVAFLCQPDTISRPSRLGSVFPKPLSLSRKRKGDSIYILESSDQYQSNLTLYRGCDTHRLHPWWKAWLSHAVVVNQPKPWATCTTPKLRAEVIIMTAGDCDWDIDCEKMFYISWPAQSSVCLKWIMNKWVTDTWYSCPSWYHIAI